MLPIDKSRHCICCAFVMLSKFTKKKSIDDAINMEVNFYIFFYRLTSDDVQLCDASIIWHIFLVLQSYHS